MNSNPTTDYASIDYSIFHTLENDVADSDPEVMVELIDIFIHDSADRLDGIDKAIEQADYRKIEISAHSLRSSSATFGALILSDICFRMEQSARARQREGIVEALATIREEFAQVSQLLSTERSKWI